jgi:hypothetical protein
MPSSGVPPPSLPLILDHEFCPLANTSCAKNRHNPSHRNAHSLKSQPPSVSDRRTSTGANFPRLKQLWSAHLAYYLADLFVNLICREMLESRAAPWHADFVSKGGQSLQRRRRRRIMARHGQIHKTQPKQQEEKSIRTDGRTIPIRVGCKDKTSVLIRSG